MFQVLKENPAKRKISVLTSFALHWLLIFVWLSRAPVFVRPSAVAWGLHGKSSDLIYFAKPQAEATTKPPRLQLKTKRRTTKEPPTEAVESARAGQSDGSLYNGPAAGIEAKPALPLVFPDPVIYPWQLTKGLQGDVVVEVTIDEKGNVTGTRILQSLQQDIDEKVISTLKNWRFQPATVDGLAISSRQDVHFHFPS